MNTYSQKFGKEGTYTHACVGGGVYLVLRCSSTNHHGNS